MKKLIIIGAGGMGRTLYDMAQESIGYKTEFVIKGFIDDNVNALDGFIDNIYPSIIGKISSYMRMSLYVLLEGNRVGYV